jgi:hypothetical protein
MLQLGLGNGDRDKNGKLAKKHGKVLISALRKTYGTAFALGMGADEKLIDVIHQLDERSLSKLRGLTGNLPPLPAIFPDMMAPVIRVADSDRLSCAESSLERRILRATLHVEI